MEQDFKDVLARERFEIGSIAARVKALMKHTVFLAPGPTMDAAETKANIMLAYRHLEDARMRLGKAIGALEGSTATENQPTAQPRKS
jgi:hypothetical protein